LNSATEEQKAAFQEIENRYLRSEGYPLETEFKGLALSFRTYRANATQILAAVRWFENQLPNPLMDPTKYDELIQFSYEVVRLFQNAVTAGQSFLDHCTTSVRRRYSALAFLQEYKVEYRSRIVHKPVCQFVEALRGFQLHNRSISAAISRGLMGFPLESSPMCQIVLNTNEFEAASDRWKGKHPKAASYLKSLRSSSIDVGRLVMAYDEPLTEFRAGIGIANSRSTLSFSTRPERLADR
jgi:hypothetical protein